MALSLTAPRLSRSPLLMVGGADRDLANDQGRRQIGGATNVWRLMGERARFDELHLDPRFLKRPGRPDLAPYRCILNIITDPDQNREVLIILRKLLRDFPGRVLNRPSDVLHSGRDEVAKLLAGIDGLHVPATLRLHGTNPKAAASAVEQAGLRFPLILRVAGSHMGNIVGLVGDMAELQAALVADARHILTGFVDFRSADGLYRKYRVYFFGDRIIARHMIISDRWNVHVSDRERCMADRPDLIEEEMALLARPDGAFAEPVHAVLRAIRARVPLDYFGMDFGILPGGEAVLFEANATMNFFPLFTNPRFAYLQSCLAPAQAAFREMVRDALRVGTV